jgi:hypothetical protein
MSVLATVLNSMLKRSRKKLIMASIRSNAFMAWAFSSGRVETEDGGYQINNPLIVGRNPNVAAYQYYDTLPITPTNEFTTVEYFWSRVAGTVIISDQEEDENKGEAQIFKLMKAKLEVLEESIKEKFSSYLYAAGGGLDPIGLASLIPDDPTSGTLGGINRATETQWRTSAYDFAGALNSTNIEEAFDDVLLDLTLKGERPDLILCGRNIWRHYRAAVRDKVVLNLSDTSNGKRMIDLGFEVTKHNGIDMLYDEDCGNNRVYFINSKYLRLHMLKGVNMRVKQLTAPWNMDVTGSRIVWQGQYCLWRAYRTHAVVIN